MKTKQRALELFTKWFQITNYNSGIYNHLFINIIVI